MLTETAFLQLAKEKRKRETQEEEKGNTDSFSSTIKTCNLINLKRGSFYCHVRSTIINVLKI